MIQEKCRVFENNGRGSWRSWVWVMKITSSLAFLLLVFIITNYYYFKGTLKPG